LYHHRRKVNYDKDFGLVFLSAFLLGEAIAVIEFLNRYLPNPNGIQLFLGVPVVVTLVLGSAASLVAGIEHSFE
jgi:hypothetical protein